MGVRLWPIEQRLPARFQSAKSSIRLGGMLPPLLACVVSILAARSAQNVDKGVRIDAAPTWVEPLALADERAPSRAASGPVEYLLVDWQDSAGREPFDAYVRIVKRVLNKQGVSSESRVTVDFDPSCEQVVFHELAVRRGAQRIEQLFHDRIRVLDTEPLLEQQVLSGERTAVLVLSDVRVGDVIEFAFTKRGRLPVFDGKYFEMRAVQSQAYVDRLRWRLRWDSEQHLHVRGRGHEVKPEISEHSGVREYVWQFEALQPCVLDPDAPTWFTPWPWIEVSEFADWQAVARWGARLFEPPAGLGPGLRAVAEGVRARSSAPKQQLLDALRYVQAEIRYFAVALGDAAYQPTPPDEVFERRYGDCKDKALLLVALLRELDIDCAPALVNTLALHAIAKRLPSPAAFDHVIVRAEIDGEELWIDPTLDFERGPLSERSLEDYGRALVLTPDTEGLATVWRDLGPADFVRVAKEYCVTGNGAARMVVESRYEGRPANDLRARLERCTLEEFARQALEECAVWHPGVVALGLPHVEDLDESNRIVVREQYSIAKLWSHVAADGHWARFNAYEVDSLLTLPGDVHRKTPLALGRPGRFEWRTTVWLPHDWRLEPTLTRIQSEAFVFQHRLSYANSELVLDIRLDTKADHVAPERIARHAADVRRARDLLERQIASPAVARSVPTGAELPTPLLAWILVVAIGAKTYTTMAARRWRA
jgi:hypothetical protein